MTITYSPKEIAVAHKLESSSHVQISGLLRHEGGALRLMDEGDQGLGIEIVDEEIKKYFDMRNWPFAQDVLALCAVNLSRRLSDTVIADVLSMSVCANREMHSWVYVYAR